MPDHRCLFQTALVAFLTLCFANVDAQQGRVQIDRVTPLFHRDTLLANAPVRFVLRYTNNTSVRVDVSNGFKISTPDGATWDSITLAPVGPKDEDGQTAFTRYFNIAQSTDMQTRDLIPSAADFVYFLGAGLHGSSYQLPVGFDDTVLAVTVWTPGPINHGKHVCLDSSFYSPSGTWVWPGRDLVDYHPELIGLAGLVSTPSQGYCFLFYDLICFTGSCCCPMYGVGNVDGLGTVDLSDLNLLVAYLTGPGITLPCPETANLNGAGIVDLSDLSALISYLTGGGFVLPACP